MSTHAHRNLPRKLLLTFGVTALALALAAPAASAAPKTKLISQNNGGDQVNSEADARDIDASGKLVLWDTDADNMDPRDTDHMRDTYLRKVGKKKTSVISLGQGGVKGNANSEYPAISRNGRYVTFTSYATDLIKGKTTPPGQCYLRDRYTSKTSLVSRNSIGFRIKGECEEPKASSSGRYIAFMAKATNLTTKDTHDSWQIYLRDEKSKRTFLVSRNSAGKAGKDDSYNPVMTPDGRFIAFASHAQNLVSKNTKDEVQVYLYDHLKRKLSLVSKTSWGAAGNAHSSRPSISDDGRYVVFESEATNLIGTKDTNGKWDIFRRDRQTGKTKRVSLDWAGGQLNGDSERADVSANGRYIIFDTDTQYVIKGGFPGPHAVPYWRDLKTGKVKLVAQSTSGAQANGFSEGRAISADGKYVAFSSKASNLIPDDKNGMGWDVFRRGPLY